MTRLLLSAAISGPSAWIVHQLLAAPLKHRIEQLRRDPHVPRRVVDELQGTAAAIREAARQYRELVESLRSEVADSVEVAGGGSGAGLGSPPIGWVNVGEAAMILGCSRRWVTALIAQGRVVAAKRGREWRIDVTSIDDYRRGVVAA